MFFDKLYNYKKTVKKINELEDKLVDKEDNYFRERTIFFKNKLKNINSIEEKEKYLNEILPETFALVREGSKRVLGLRHYDVQLLGGQVIHFGNVAEMKTGEGKTLVITSAAYLNALLENGVHVITVNDYLAKRDMEKNKKLYEFLGLSVGVIQHDMQTLERQENYSKDITYVTNSELGFDYLRNNLVKYKEDILFEKLHYAIIDEVDSILIDEARTPLIISQQDLNLTTLYTECDKLVKNFKIIFEKDIKEGEEDIIENTYDAILEKLDKTVYITKNGIKKTEKYFKTNNISNKENDEIFYHVMLSLKANYLLEKDIDYIISKKNKIEIVDEFTGRVLGGRQYSNGLHQAIETKENVPLSEESNTLASITYKDLFQQYYKMSGISGTVKSEEKEFIENFNMNVLVVPTNKPIQRIDHKDIIFSKQQYKYNYILNIIKDNYKLKRPILIGSPSIKISEYISEMLSKDNIPHEVLNAKNNEREAEIISHAGEIGKVTVATNMAGRGTDIIISDESKKLGGLLVLGIEKNISCRIDNQLRGRAGRQGDVGESFFFSSLEDDIFLNVIEYSSYKKLFKKYKNTIGPIKNMKINKLINKAQNICESLNSETRITTNNYNCIISRQREFYYKLRKIFLTEISIQNIFKKSYDFYMELNNLNKDKQKILNDFLINKLKLKEEENVIDKLNSVYVIDNNEIDYYRITLLENMDESFITYINALDSLKNQSNYESLKQINPYMYFINTSNKYFIQFQNEIFLKNLKFLLLSLKRKSIVVNAKSIISVEVHNKEENSIGIINNNNSIIQVESKNNLNDNEIKLVS